MFKKLLSVLVLLLPIIAFSQQAPIEIKVGSSPTFVYGYYDFNVHDFKIEIITLGKDSNFNRIEDPDDEKPAWYRLSYQKLLTGNLEPDLMQNFNFATIPFPTRVYINEFTKELLVPDTNSTVSKFNLATGEFEENFNAKTNEQLDDGADIRAIYKSNEFLLVSFSNFEDKNYINVINTSTKEIVVSNIPAPLGCQQIFINNDKLYILGEGLLGSDNSELWIYSLNDVLSSNEVEPLKKIKLGDTGNHLSKISNSLIAVTCNFSHKVQLIDLNQHEIIKEIELPTQGFNGPRETQPFGENLIATTAFDGNLYFHNLDGTQISKITLGNNLEGLYTFVSTNPMFKLELAVVASPFNDDYSPNNSVFILLNFLSTEDNFSNSQVKIFPTPASNKLFVDLSNSVAKFNTLRILDLTGNVLYQTELNESNLFEIPLNNFSSGTYFISLLGSEISVIPFIVNN